MAFTPQALAVVDVFIMVFSFPTIHMLEIDTLSISAINWLILVATF